MEQEPAYILHATAIVGCSISFFFCLLALLALFCFRPPTEALAVKKHLTLAVCATQFFLLVAISGYTQKVGCRALSALLHFSGTACFSWCTVDALCLYFFHANSFHPIKSLKVYVLFGWGIPLVVLVTTILVGFLGAKSIHLLALYTCWTSDHVLWSFVVPSIILTAVNIVILCTILRQLRQPSYDVCPKSVIEKRGTRYGLRTNSLMLLGLCLGWIFTMLSFRDVNNVRYQLTFGLVNGLQGIFLFFFHCVLNSDHVKNSGYSTAVQQKAPGGSGRGMPDGRGGKRVEPQNGSRRKAGFRNPVKENVPLISIGTGSANKQEDESSESSPTKQEPTNSLCAPTTLHVIVANAPVRPRPVETIRPKSVEQLRVTPDYEMIIPQLPGTPEENPKDRENTSPPTGRASTAPSRSSNKQMPASVVSSRSSSASNGRESGDMEAKQINQITLKRPDSSGERRRKTRSEPTIPYADSGRNGDSAKRTSSGGETASRFRAHTTDNKPHKHSRQHGSSLNELESLFSNPEFMAKPHRPSVSSLQGPGRRERRVSSEQSQGGLNKRSSADSRDVETQGSLGQIEGEGSSSRPHSRSTQQTIL